MLFLFNTTTSWTVILPCNVKVYTVDYIWEKDATLGWPIPPFFATFGPVGKTQIGYGTKWA